MQNNSYFQNRLLELGIDKEHNANKIELKSEGRSFECPIFSEDVKGNIKILLYQLDRNIIEYDHPKANPQTINSYTDKIQTYYITRLHPDNVIGSKKYSIPKGQGTFPFFPKSIIEKYEKQEKIKTLFLTEGAFKSFKGALHGLDIVGLSSIHHYRNKETKALHKDILELIKVCAVENLFMLYDADCLDISESGISKKKELTERPYKFFSSVVHLKELTADLNVQFYFSHIKSEISGEKPKGLDDLLILKKGAESEVIEDIQRISFPSIFIHKINVTHSTNELKKYFNLVNVTDFYDFHKEQIGKNEFAFFRTIYQFNGRTERVDELKPAHAFDYMRVGNDYYHKFLKPNKNKDLEESMARRNKSIIVEDYGTKFLKYISKYNDFTNVPSHDNYQQEINNCYNMYSPFLWTPEEGEFPVIMNFLEHIFEEHLQLALDYIQLLYKKPTQKLPIICLVSKENKTGKSTFAKLLQLIFSQNVTIIGNAEISNEFNSHLNGKLVIAIDEGFIEKKAIVEKIKNMATADSLPMTAKGKDTIDMPFFGKIIILSNNVDNFITASKDDERYWVREIKKPTESIPNILESIKEEIPAFLYYLDKREMTTKNEDRAWFKSSLILTDAFKRVVEASKPKIVRSIEYYLKEMFLNTKEKEIHLHPKDIKELWFDKQNTIDEEYILKTLKEHFKKAIRQEQQRYKIPILKEQESIEEAPTFVVNYLHKNSRPFLFLPEHYLSEEEFLGISDFEEEMPF